MEISTEHQAGSFSDFIALLKEFLPPEAFLVSGQPNFEKFTNSTLPFEQSVNLAVRPTSVNQVQQIVVTATRCSVPLYPISGGNNWGYGCAQPASAGSVIVDLGLLNSIVEVDRDLAFAVIEPGVTQGQLYKYLAENRIPLLVDISGAGPDSSLLGNAVERGYGLGPYGDHFAAVCGMEVVLPNGELLKTGFGRFESAQTAHVYKWGVGPYLEGLFSQSNFGIVTKIGLWLQPIPEQMEICLGQLSGERDLSKLTDVVRTLQLEETVRTRVNILSRNRLITLYEQYPWKEMNGVVPMSEGVAEMLAKRHVIGDWNVMFGLYGSAAQVRAAKKRVKQLLSPICDRLIIASDSRLRMLERFARPLGMLTGLPLPRLIPSLRLALGIYGGNPTSAALRTPYWRHRSMTPPEQARNPSRDNCGIIWFAPILKMMGGEVERFSRLAGEICRRYGFDFAPTFTAVNARALDCSLPILFDRENQEDCRKASACYEELESVCSESGFFPYRLGIQAMARNYDEMDPYWKFIAALKDSIDPKNILAPGRYGPPIDR